MAIRYDKKLNQEINKTIRNFNQKIARLEKQERELLPEKITKKQLKQDVYTRTELYRKLNELKRFSKRGAEDIITTTGGVTTTRYNLENLKRENARIKRNLTREIKRLETTKPKIFGKTQAVTFAKMGDPTYLNLKARRKALDKKINKLNKEGFKTLVDLVKKTGKSQVYMNTVFKGNYYEMLTDLAYYVGYDNEKLNYLKEKLMKLKPNDFLKVFNEDKSIKAIVEYYPAVTGIIGNIDPDDIKDDITGLYDTLIDNIDEILKDYA